MVYQTIRIAFLDDKANNDDSLPPVSVVFHNVDYFKEGGTIIIHKEKTGFEKTSSSILGINEERIVSFVASNPREEKKRKEEWAKWNYGFSWILLNLCVKP